MSETPVTADLLQPLEILTELRVDIVGQDLAVLSVYNILLSVEEPQWNLELCRVLHDIHDSFELVRVQVTSALLQIDIGLFADNVGVTTTHALDFSQSVLDLALAINVGIEETQNVLELLVLLRDHERHNDEGFVADTIRQIYWRVRSSSEQTLV